MAGGRLRALGYDNSETPFYVAVGLGMVAGFTRVSALGHNPNIAVAGTAADIWEGGGDYPFLAAASQLEVLSASASDTAAAGTGARTVLVSGLDANYNPISEVLALNGTTPVPTVRSYLRVNVFTTTASGSGKKNAGDLTLRVVGGGTTIHIARAGDGYGRSAVFSVQAGFTLFIPSVLFTILAADPKTNAGATCGIQLIGSNGNSRTPLQIQVISTTPYRHDTLMGISLAEKSDITLRVMNAQQINTNVTAAFEGFLVDNTQLT